METITIQVPDGCEVQIVRKEEKKEPVIRTYQDLISTEVVVNGFYIDNTFGDDVKISRYNNAIIALCNKDVAASEKVAKSMLAMAQISQLMPYYGGEVTDKEWNDGNITKFVIERIKNEINTDYYNNSFHFLAFHTAEQRDNFLKYNEQLVKDYLMID